MNDQVAEGVGGIRSEGWNDLSAAFPGSGIVTGLPDDLDALAAEIHADNIKAGWWKRHIVVTDNVASMGTIPRNIGELLCLVHSEISEAADGLLGNLPDDKLPHRKMFEVELADVSIRVLDILGYYKPEFPLALEREVMAVLFPVLVYGSGDGHPLLLAMHSTVSAAMEHFRKGRVEEGCTQLWLLLHIIDWAAGSFALDLSGAIAEKRQFNRDRADHKFEHCAAVGGNAF